MKHFVILILVGPSLSPKSAANTFSGRYGERMYASLMWDESRQMDFRDETHRSACRLPRRCRTGTPTGRAAVSSRRRPLRSACRRLRA